MDKAKPKATIGPFRATKLWNTIINDFRADIPLKRHRWRMRYYDNCFTTTEAIDWLHNYLCTSENFGPWVTRSQVILLLDKFVHSKIIEEVKTTSKGPTKEQTTFEDNGHLYKFLPVSPIKKLRSALRSRSSLNSLSPSPKKRVSAARTARPLAVRDGNIHQPPTTVPVAKELPACRLVVRPLTTDQIEDVWKSATLKRLQRLLWLSTLDGLLDASVIIPSHIIHNCSHISRNGVVQLKDHEDKLPHWVLSAMRCLVNWPSKVDSELPSYPGFERDVFKTISNYFENLPEPLITYNRYHLLVEAFVVMEYRDRGMVPGEEVIPHHRGVNRGLTSYESVESLMMNMTVGGRHMLSDTPTIEGNPKSHGNQNSGSGARQVRRSSSFGQVQGMLRSDTPHCPSRAGLTRREIAGQFASTEALCVGNANTRQTRNVHFARAARSNPQKVPNHVDDYGFANLKPVRDSDRPLSASGYLGTGHPSHTNQSNPEKTQKFSPKVPPRKCTSLTNIQEAERKAECFRSKSGGGGLFSSKKFGSATELVNRFMRKKSPYTPLQGEDDTQKLLRKSDDKHVTVNQPIISPGLAPPPSYPILGLSPEEGPHSTSASSSQNTTPASQPGNNISPPYPPPLKATLSFSEISAVQNASTTPPFMPSAILGSTYGNRKSASASNLATSTPQYENIHPPSSHKRLKRQDSVTSISSLYLSEDRSYCQEALRLCLLLLPPPQRRALHLLLRMMSKVEQNQHLILTNTMTTRQLLLHTFSRCILRCRKEVDLDEALAMRIVAYLMDNHSTVFSIPQELRDDIEERLTYLRRSQIKYGPETENMEPAAYCHQVSVEEYEKQKSTSSQKAIEDLLDNIITDKAMPPKEKKKKLKLFQKAYPEIYHRRLPTSTSEAELLPDRPKLKQPMMNVKRSLSKLKSIR